MPPLRVKPKVYVQVSDAEAKQMEADEAFLRACDAGNLDQVLKGERKGNDLNIADTSTASATDDGITTASRRRAAERR